METRLLGQATETREARCWNASSGRCVMPSGSTACPPVTTTCQPPTSKVSEPGGGAVPLEGVEAGTIVEKNFTRLLAQHWAKQS